MNGQNGAGYNKMTDYFLSDGIWRLFCDSYREAVTTCFCSEAHLARSNNIRSILPTRNPSCVKSWGKS